MSLSSWINRYTHIMTQKLPFKSPLRSSKQFYWVYMYSVILWHFSIIL